MQQEHKDSLRRNFARLVKETPVDAVVDHLYRCGTLTDELKDNILQHSNSYSKVRQLLLTLQSSGSSAFDDFCSALMTEGKLSLADVLKPEGMTETTESSKELCMIPIGNDIFVVANKFSDKIWIHIRKYEKNSTGGYYPTKKGVALCMNQWLLLEMYVSAIDNAIGHMIDDVNEEHETAFHLGQGVYVTLNKTFPTVDVRQRWRIPESGNVVPTKRGVSLTYDKWEALKDLFPEVRRSVPELEETLPCICTDSHQNQEGMLSCSFCNPFGDLF